MYNVFLVLFSITSISLIITILLQNNKSQVNFSNNLNNSLSHNMLGLKGDNGIISRITTILAILFFIFSLILNNFNNKNITKEDNKWNNIDHLNISDKKSNSSLDDIPY